MRADYIGPRPGGPQGTGKLLKLLQVRAARFEPGSTRLPQKLPVAPLHPGRCDSSFTGARAVTNTTLTEALSPSCHL